MYRAQSVGVSVANLRLTINCLVRVQQKRDFVTIAIADGLDQLLVHQVLRMPEVRPWLDLALGADQLKLGVHVEILVDVDTLLVVLLNVLLNVVDTHVLVLLDIVE